MANENALSKVIDFTPIVPVVTTPTKRTRQITFFCQPLEDLELDNKYVLVTSKEDLATYTTDNRAGAFFDNGHNQIYLLFPEFTEEDIKYVSARTFSLVVSADAGDDASVSDFSSFNGLKYYTEDNSIILTTETIASELSNTFGTSVWYAGESSNLKERFSGWLTSESLNSTWRSGQYKQFSGEPVIIKNNTEVDQAREQQFSFCYADGLEISVPAIFYARAGGINLADYYIVEDIINNIQLNSYLYIANNDPTYINLNLGVLVSIGESVLNQYGNANLIVREGSSYTIPARESQTVIDVTNGLVNGISLIIESGSAIWYLKGTVQATISDTINGALTTERLSKTRHKLSDNMFEILNKQAMEKHKLKQEDRKISNSVETGNVLSMSGKVVSKNTVNIKEGK